MPVFCQHLSRWLLRRHVLPRSADELRMPLRDLLAQRVELLFGEHRLRGLEQLPLFPPDVIVKRRAELAKRLTPLGVSGCILHARHKPVHRQVVAVEPLDLRVVDRAVPDESREQALALRVEVRQQPP